MTTFREARVLNEWAVAPAKQLTRGMIRTPKATLGVFLGLIGTVAGEAALIIWRATR